MLNGWESDCDILEAVRSRIRSLLPYLPKLFWRHVKGHKSRTNLDIVWALFSIQVDMITGEAYEYISARTRRATITYLDAR